MTAFASGYFSKSMMYGVDPSPESIRVAQQLHHTIHFSANYDEKPDLGFENDMFDIVFAAGAFHHILFNKHLGYIQEISRVLKNNGAFVMFELNPFNPLTVRTFNRNPIDQNACMLKPSYAAALCRNAFPNKTITTKFYCFFPRLLKWFRPTEKYLTKFPMGALYAIIVT